MIQVAYVESFCVTQKVSKFDMEIAISERSVLKIIDKKS